MALDENKVIDVPDEADDDDEDVDDNEESEDNDEKSALPKEIGASTTNGKKLDSLKKSTADEADSTGDAENSMAEKAGCSSKPPTGVDEVSSSNGTVAAIINDDERPSTSNGDVTASTSNGASAVMDGEQEDDNEESEGVSGSLQLAWEILEAAAKIFSRQGLSSLPYLADVQTELANIEFENGILDAAREDYGRLFNSSHHPNLLNCFCICRESFKDTWGIAQQESSYSGRIVLQDWADLSDATDEQGRRHSIAQLQ